jgi:hypothetical protein
MHQGEERSLIDETEVAFERGSPILSIIPWRPMISEDISEFSSGNLLSLRSQAQAAFDP